LYSDPTFPMDILNLVVGKEDSKKILVHDVLLENSGIAEVRVSVSGSSFEQEDRRKAKAYKKRRGGSYKEKS
jgi:hypothetical protein